MNEKKWVNKLANWHSALLILLEWSGVALLILTWAELSSSIDKSTIVYIYASLLICVGVLIVVFSTIIGSFVYEANRRQLTWLWKILRYKEKVIEKAFSRPPYEYSFTILIMRIVGIGAIITSVLIAIFTYFRT